MRWNEDGAQDPHLSQVFPVLARVILDVLGSKKHGGVAQVFSIHAGYGMKWMKISLSEEEMTVEGKRWVGPGRRLFRLTACPATLHGSLGAVRLFAPGKLVLNVDQLRPSRASQPREYERKKIHKMHI